MQRASAPHFEKQRITTVSYGGRPTLQARMVRERPLKNILNKIRIAGMQSKSYLMTLCLCPSVSSRTWERHKPWRRACSTAHKSVQFMQTQMYRVGLAEKKLKEPSDALQVMSHVKKEQLGFSSLLSTVCFPLVPNLLCSVSIQRFAHTKCLWDVLQWRGWMGEFISSNFVVFTVKESE